MPITVKRRPARATPDYNAACKQTVTLYNAYKAGGVTQYHRTIFDGTAYLEAKRVYQETKTGVTATNPSLLVIPQGASGHLYVPPGTFDAMESKTGFFTLRNGDKVVPGVGQDIATADDWAVLIPAKVPGAVVIAAADVKRTLAGDIAHVEGGG